MNLIKEEVLEKLAKQKKDPTTKESFIQKVEEDGIIYQREYIAGQTDRYFISQTTSKWVEHWEVVGDYDQPANYIKQHQCQWQQEFLWDGTTQTWKKKPTEITLKNWEEGENRRIEGDVLILEGNGKLKGSITSTTLRGEIPVESERNGFASLWNFYTRKGEKEFLALKQAGYGSKEFQERLDLFKRIALAKARYMGLGWDALKGAVIILAKNGQNGKAAARELIRMYRIEHHL